jgi:hypothetical protein
MAKAKRAVLRAKLVSVTASISNFQIDEARVAVSGIMSTTVRLIHGRHDCLRTVTFHARPSMHRRWSRVWT